jgi:hypothetical protein
VLVRVNFDEKDPLLKHKEELMQDKPEGKNFRIMANYEEPIVMEFFAYVRFVVLQDKEKIILLYVINRKLEINWFF